MDKEPNGAGDEADRAHLVCPGSAAVRDSEEIDQGSDRVPIQNVAVHGV